MTEDTIVHSYVVKLTEASDNVSISSKQIVRRFMEERRCVIVWWSLFKPQRESDGVMGTESKKWCSETPAGASYQKLLPCSQDLDRLRSSRVSTSRPCCRMTRVSRATVGVLTDLVSSRDESIKASHLQLENLLLVESMKA